MNGAETVYFTQVDTITSGMLFFMQKAFYEALILEGRGLIYRTAKRYHVLDLSIWTLRHSLHIFTQIFFSLVSVRVGNVRVQQNINMGLIASCM